MRQGANVGRPLDETPRGVEAGRPARRTLLTLGGLTIVAFGLGAAGRSAPASAEMCCEPSGVRRPLRGESHQGRVIGAAEPRGGRRAASAPSDTQVPDSPEYYVDAGPNVIALTIDDGPDPTYTPQVLEVLSDYGVTATFFMIGQQIQGNESVVSQVSGDGHMIGNHTWDHADQTQLSADQVAEEIQSTNDALGALGVTPGVFRAPYGNWNDTVFQACADAGLRPVDWSVDPQDWSMPGVDAIVENIMANTATGSIILEHDGGGDRSQTVAALKIVLPRLLDGGFSFTTV